MSLLPPDVEMEKDEGHGSDMESDEIEEEQQDDEEEEGEGEAEEDDDHDLEVRELDHSRWAVQEHFWLALPTFHNWKIFVRLKLFAAELMLPLFCSLEIVYYP